jgi:hypothetical protein
MLHRRLHHGDDAVVAVFFTYFLPSFGLSRRPEHDDSQGLSSRHIEHGHALASDHRGSPRRRRALLLLLLSLFFFPSCIITTLTTILENNNHSRGTSALAGLNQNNKNHALAFDFSTVLGPGQDKKVDLYTTQQHRTAYPNGLGRSSPLFSFCYQRHGVLGKRCLLIALQDSIFYGSGNPVLFFLFGYQRHGILKLRWSMACFLFFNECMWYLSSGKALSKYDGSKHQFMSTRNQRDGFLLFVLTSPQYCICLITRRRRRHGRIYTLRWL